MKLFCSEKKVNNKIKALYTSFNFANKNENLELVFVGIMKGGLYTMFKFMDGIDRPYEYGFVNYQTYQDGLSPYCNPELMGNFLPEVKEKHVVIIDDIIDTGKTMEAAYYYIKLLGAEKISIVTLLARKGLTKKYDSFYYGFMVDKGQFAVGCGMGLGEKYRNLSSIYILEDEDI
ncbi:MAG TPA: phosphoribosyltransferase family protein [Bacillota bacterium]|nr:phosphoribosyltransferase family protein [Bacillota bacterium]